MTYFKRILAILLSVSLMNVTMVQTASAAALVSTEQVAGLASTDASGTVHARLTEALSRADVRAALEGQGVDPAQAMDRVSALTDEEAGRLAAQIDSAPAGGIIGVILTIFVVLLVTDILGFTKVFPFTRSIR